MLVRPSIKATIIDVRASAAAAAANVLRRPTMHSALEQRCQRRRHFHSRNLRLLQFSDEWTRPRTSIPAAHSNSVSKWSAENSFLNSDIGHKDSFSGNVALMELSLNTPILFSNKSPLFGLPAELLATQRHSSTSPTIITELYTQNDSCICIFVIAYVAIPFFYTMTCIYFLLHGFHLW